jgi:hypothetical protein
MCSTSCAQLRRRARQHHAAARVDHRALGAREPPHDLLGGRLVDRGLAQLLRVAAQRSKSATSISFEKMSIGTSTSTIPGGRSRRA